MADIQQVQVPQGMVTLEELFRQKGELVTQLEIAQGRLQLINGQIQQLFNSQAMQPK